MTGVRARLPGPRAWYAMAGGGCTAAGYSVNRSPDYRTLADARHGAADR